MFLSDVQIKIIRFLFLYYRHKLRYIRYIVRLQNLTSTYTGLLTENVHVYKILFFIKVENMRIIIAVASLRRVKYEI